jgi:CubicO group peptidase (beta-lactamase class C family)
MGGRRRHMRTRKQTGKVDLSDVDGVVEGLLKREFGDGGAFAGAVLLVSQGAEVLKHSAYGYAELFDGRGNRLRSPRPMQAGTVFDLASITKVAATANLLARSFQQGALLLTDAVSEYLPAFDRADKRGITVWELLSHSSGLANWLPFYLFVDSGDDAVELAAELPLAYERGRRRAYSDVNFVVLGKLLETVTGKPLDQLFRQEVAEPLSLSRTRYRPPAEWRAEIAATSVGNRMERRMCEERTFPRTPPRQAIDLPGWRRHVLVGEVNDANCHLVFGGVSGHAGLFGTADDLARMARSLLDSLSCGSLSKGSTKAASHWLSPDTAHYFTTPKLTPGQGLGWWTNRLDVSPRTFGHRGFTGGQLFIDPENELIIILLTNRTHSDLPYADPRGFSEQVAGSIYRGLGIADGAKVDPWLDR